MLYQLIAHSYAAQSAEVKALTACSHIWLFQGRVCLIRLRELQELDCFAVQHPTTKPLGDIEHHSRLVAERVTQDARANTISDDVATLEVTKRDAQVAGGRVVWHVLSFVHWITEDRVLQARCGCRIENVATGVILHAHDGEQRFFVHHKARIGTILRLEFPHQRIEVIDRIDG